MSQVKDGVGHSAHHLGAVGTVQVDDVQVVDVVQQLVRRVQAQGREHARVRLGQVVCSLVVNRALPHLSVVVRLCLGQVVDLGRVHVVVRGQNSRVGSDQVYLSLGSVRCLLLNRHLGVNYS